MTTTPLIPLQYIQTDIPAGVTIRDWRRARPQEKRSRIQRLFGLPAASSRP
jgi:hypothetical protein